MDEYIARRTLRRADGGAFSSEDVGIIVEEPLEVRVNGEPYAVVMRTPGHELELAAGFCLTEGVVDSYSEIIHLDFCSKVSVNSGNVVNVVTDPDASPEACGDTDARGFGRGRTLPSRSGCGICGVRMLDDMQRRLVSVPAGPEVDMDWLAGLQSVMYGRQRLFQATRGGCHAVLLARAGGEVLVVREDVGRHNALDKAIGHAMVEGVDLRDAVALLSSRVSFEMVQKAVRAGIPIVAGVSAATTLAVDLAERTGCTLVGRLRGRDMTVYTRPERIRGAGCGI